MYGKRENRVRVSSTERLREFIRESEADHYELLSTEQWAKLKTCAKNDDCTVEEIRMLSLLLSKIKRIGGEETQSGLSLKELLKGTCGVKFPVEPKKEPNPELVERRQYLIAKQQQREYAAMCKNLQTGMNGKRQENVMDRSAMDKASNAVSMILMVVSVFIAGYWCATEMGYNKSVALISGLILAIIMLLVEMTLYIIRATREESKLALNRKKKQL